MGKWVITCNPNYYDIIGAFNKFEILEWKQSANIQVGDIVYIYVGKPYAEIKYETEVIAVDLQERSLYDSDFVIEGSNFADHKRYMKLQLLRIFEDGSLPYKILRNEGLNSVQGPSRMTNELEDYILNKINHSIENKLDQQLLDDVDTLLKGTVEHQIVYIPKPKEKTEAYTSEGKRAYQRNRKVATKALIRANHKCEINVEHPIFLRRNTNVSYTEPHHLIPMAFQNKYEYSLDVEANIVSLCSNCHNQIHYGEDSDKLIEALYERRKDELKRAGISIKLPDLLNLYQ